MAGDDGHYIDRRKNRHVWAQLGRGDEYWNHDQFFSRCEWCHAICLDVLPHYRRHRKLVPWIDPILPKLATPTYEFLKANPIHFGNYSTVMSPQQWEMTFCTERFPGWVGGTRSGKSIGGVFRSLKHTLWIPGNRGIVGRFTQTDLQDTSQRDFYEIADQTGLVKNKNDRKMVLYCCDPSGRILDGKPTSEVLFLHFDNPNHLKGHGIGWFWMDEGSEMNPKAFYRLVDRLSHPAAAGHYTGFVTSNPEGRNWIFDHWYNPEKVEALPTEARLMRRGIHNRTRDNPFLTEEYLKMQYATSPPEWIRRYMDGEFDVFEGQIFKEFSHDLHCVRSRECKGWDGHEPPKLWPRYMGIDAGGADPWAFEASAVDPWGNMIFYDEVYRPEVYVGSFEKELKQIIDGRNFVKFPMDWENKASQEELRRIGIRVTNAFKRNKLDSINRMARYIHPNPDRAFPAWHPRAGEPGSPGIFFTERVPNLVRELPQQRWKKVAGYDIEMNEPDPKVSNHAWDGSLYVLRERPRPEEALLTLEAKFKQAGLDKRSAAYYLMEQQAKEREEKQQSRSRILLPFRRAPQKEGVFVS